LHSILFSLILTPNVPTLVCGWCMIKHEAVTWDWLTICPIQYPKGMFQVSPTSCHVLIIVNLLLLIFCNYLFWNSIMCETCSWFCYVQGVYLSRMCLKFHLWC
jgi:hypothetical protein